MVHNTVPLVTIAIPTYNRANGYLKNAIGCALTQTYQNVEVVISDNCSSDNTEEVVKGFNDPRIRYFRQSFNIGANNNFNFCLEKAQGIYFLLLHDDDAIDADFIDICMRSANYRTDIGLIRTGTRVIDGEGKVIIERRNQIGGASTEDFFLGWFSGKTVLYLCSTLFNTTGLKALGGFGSKHNLFQDVFAEVQLVSRLGRADVQDVKASFRKHKGEMTFAAAVVSWCEDSLLLLDLMSELSSEKREQVRRSGMKFFARLNYMRAMAVRSPLRRFQAYFTVFKNFHYRYLPPRAHATFMVAQLLYGTVFYDWLRTIKNRVNS
ncbi:MAG: glycosyltransferase family 2 protein [Thermodesulfovibrionales bacterium]